MSEIHEESRDSNDPEIFEDFIPLRDIAVEKYHDLTLRDRASVIAIMGGTATILCMGIVEETERIGLGHVFLEEALRDIDGLAGGGVILGFISLLSAAYQNKRKR